MYLFKRHHLPLLINKIIILFTLTNVISSITGFYPIYSKILTHNNTQQILKFFSKVDEPFYLIPLTTIYISNNMQQLWKNKDEIKSFEEQIAEVAISGIQPQFTHWVNLLTNPKIKDFSRDIVLSDAMLGYLHFISEVTKNNILYNNKIYKLDLPSINILNQWQRAIHRHSLNKFIQSLAPSSALYKPMHNNLKLILKINITPNIKCIDKSLSKYETKKSYVYKCHQKLSNNHQWLHISPQTSAALLGLNIQRLRTLPDIRHNVIIINIPDYSLIYFHKNQEKLFSKVIIGRIDRKTPIIQSIISKILLNPVWNVPALLVHDIISKIKLDHNYLSKNGFELYSRRGDDSQIIDPAKINWRIISPSSFPYYIRQLPSTINAMGKYKFDLPNLNSVYLHDTPNHYLFKSHIRTMSSGCIRIDKAHDLTKSILKKNNYDYLIFSKIIKNNQTQSILIDQNILVSVVYLTASMNSNSQLQFKKDIYNYDYIMKLNANFYKKIIKLLY